MEARQPDRLNGSLPIDPGAGSFGFADGQGKPLPVWYYRPPGLPENAPIVFVMHGVKRDAAYYRDNWMVTAERFGFLLVCPEFARADYPHRTAYQLGNVIDSAGEPLPKDRWSFGVIERLFDYVRVVTGNRSERYYLYGHSAGGQFVHRLALFLPEARYATAVAANTGWYTMPTLRGRKFPYGLRGSGTAAETLEQAFSNHLVILLGEQDTDAADPFLRRSKGAKRQGRNRFERGLAFYAAAEREAATLGVRLNWTLETVPGAAHFDQLMMPAAAEALFRGELARALRDKTH
ncbi:MAG: alpha/beta hydrolase [Rubrobacter sp.]